MKTPGLRLPHPRGSVLLYTLVILLFMSFLGLALLFSTNTELNIASNASDGHTAFSVADSAADIAVLMSRMALNPVLGDFDQTFGSIRVKVRDDFSLALLQNEGMGAPGAQSRYHTAAYTAGESGSKPHITIVGGDSGAEGIILATAVVSLDRGRVIKAGSSLGGGGYDGAGGASIEVGLVISVIGYSKGRSEFTATGSAESDSPRSIITTVIREVIN